MAQWFIYVSDYEVLGPLTPSELLNKVRRGEVVAETPLRKDDSAWFRAKDVGGLFDAATKPTIVWRCPGCHSKLSSAPPCVCMQCGRELVVALQERTENRVSSPEEIAKQSGVSRSMKDWLAEKVRRKKP